MTGPEMVNMRGGLDDKVYSKDGSPCSTSFENVCDFGNLVACAKECCANVRWKQSVQMFEIDMLRWISSIKRDLENGTYRTKGFKHFWIVERGKKRHIQSVHISERVVQKSLVQNVLSPVILPRLISANGASIKGKGTGYALKRLKRDMAHAYKKSGPNFYIAVTDFHDYFASISHEKVLSMIKPLIDKRSFELLEHFVNAFDGDYGLGLGSEISQILAIFYANEIDHAMKEKYHIKEYERHMDDIYMAHESKEHLKKCIAVIEEMGKDLNLSLNKNKTVITKKRFIFLKKRILIESGGKIVIKPGRKNITYMRKKVKSVGQKIRDGEAEKKRMIELKSAWHGFVKGLDAWDTDKSMRKLMKEEINNVCDSGTACERN